MSRPYNGPILCGLGICKGKREGFHKVLDKLHISKIMQIYVFYMPFLVLLCIIMMTLVRVLLFSGRGESIGLPLFLFNEVCPARKIPGQGRLR